MRLTDIYVMTNCDGIKGISERWILGLFPYIVALSSNIGHFEYW